MHDEHDQVPASDSAAAPDELESIEVLGSVTVPTGTLCVLDCGMFEWVLNGSIPEVPVVEVEGVPANVSLDVHGAWSSEAEFEGCWDWVAVVISADADIATSERVGMAIVDWARLLIADASAVESWSHIQPVDGLADLVLWGRDARLLADAIHAPELGEGQFGWTDMEAEDCYGRALAAAHKRQEAGWLLAIDYRPHSHHFQLLEQLRRSATESATLGIGAAQVCLFFTSWGDGGFPVFRDLDADGNLVRVRIQLQTEASREAMRTVNRQ